MANKIKCVLLDLGDVVFEVDWERFAQPMGFASHQQVEEIRTSQAHDHFERGQMSELDFFRYLRSQAQNQLSESEIMQAWNSVIVGEISGVHELIEKTKANVSFFALTNSNPSHITREVVKHPVCQHFQKILTSYELRARKPEEKIYRKAVEEIGCRPNEILFLDDKIENVEAARALGLHAEVCLNSATTMAQIFANYLVVDSVGNSA